LYFAEGERVLLLGANGAGKSTLLRIVAGLTRPDSGSISLRVSGRISLFSHHLFLYPRLTVQENLSLFAALQEDSLPLSQSLEAWGLSAHASTPVSALSKGNQARVALARASLVPSPVLLLDEPTSNLDERGASQLRAVVDGLKTDRGGAPIVIVATHDLHRLGDFASRVVVMHQGAVIADSGPHAGKEALHGILQVYRESNR
jgi:ABC-type multidrug transport system ATPase subunit